MHTLIQSVYALIYLSPSPLPLPPLFPPSCSSPFLHSLNEIGRWSDSSAKDPDIKPIDRVQGEFKARVKVMATMYSKASTTRWVAGILTSQVTSVRTLISKVGLEHLPCEGGFELLTADKLPSRTA